MKNRTPLRSVTDMSLVIDSTKCQGHGRCVMIEPDLFDVDDDGYGIVLNAEPSPELLESMQKAIDSCPEEAIFYTP